MGIPNCFFFAFALLLQAGNFRNELALERLAFLEGCFGHLAFEEDFFLRDFGMDHTVDLGDLLFLFESELHNRRGFFQSAHGKFVSGFHGSIVTNPRFHTQKNCRQDRQGVKW